MDQKTDADIQKIKERIAGLEEALRRSQHLITIGQLAAGITHEINTPMQYVSGNITYLQDYFQDLTTIINTYRDLMKHIPENSPAHGKIREILKLEEEKDIEYILEDIPNMLEEIRSGIKLVTEITWSIKEFSHPGKNEKTPVNLNHLLDDVINVTRNEWKYNSEVLREYDSDLPEINSYQSDLKQVFTNLIVNASHAIKEKAENNPDFKGKIIVKTYRDGDFVSVVISDNGPGIPEELKSRIFEPFFTTKPEGIGTGQGLAITRSIVIEKHNGKIEIETAIEKGTAFIIKLPMKNNKN